MLTRYLTSVSTAFSPFNPKSGKTARTFLAMLPPNARQSMTFDVKMLGQAQKSVPATLALKFKDGKEMTLDLEKMNGAAGSGSLERLQTMDKGLRQLVADLISLPMPTIAAVSGHAAAAGCMLAMSHDYVLMRRDRGVLYMSELDIRMTLPDYFMAMMRTKIGSPMAQREMLLRAAKVKAEEAVKMGIIDSAHDNAAETVVAAVRLGEQLSRRKWDGEVYAEIRKASFPELCGLLGLVHSRIFRPRL